MNCPSQESSSDRACADRWGAKPGDDLAQVVGDAADAVAEAVAVALHVGDLPHHVRLRSSSRGQDQLLVVLTGGWCQQIRYLEPSVDWAD